MSIDFTPGARPVDLAAYYFPGYHPDASTSQWHGAGWTEWDVLAAARPRFEGHRQPRASAWGVFNEAEPEWAAKQAKLAADNGIGVFLFDWYWYNGGPFLNGALDNGFLQVNDPGTQFAIMWANHDWLDLHPAGLATPPNVLFRGAVSDREFDALSDELIGKYFLHPGYYRPNGAPYFSIYEPQTLVDGFGSLTRAAAAIERLRERTIRAGLPDLHLNIVVTDRAVLPGERMTGDIDQLVSAFAPTSATSYVWIHHYDPARDGFPLGDYQRAAEANAVVWEHLRSELSVPYYPNVTVNWDSSPRTVQSDRFTQGDYPWMAILDGSPQQYGAALTRALDFAGDGRSGSTPLVTINAWNEWTEGSYLLPDTHHGMAYLDETKAAVARARATWIVQ